MKIRVTIISAVLLAVLCAGVLSIRAQGRGQAAKGPAASTGAAYVPKVKVGQTAPDFKLPASTGKTVSLKDFRGTRVVLYFYPKDETPGCTTEACSFRDNLTQIKGKNAVVLGVSPDSVGSHLEFIKKYNLPFVLLSDKGGKVAQSYGVWGERDYGGKKWIGNLRTTFLIDEKGKVVKVWPNVGPNGHAEQILAALG